VREGGPTRDGAGLFDTEEKIHNVVRRNGPGRYAVYFKPEPGDCAPGEYNAEEEAEAPSLILHGCLILHDEGGAIEFEEAVASSDAGDDL
jgi:hypothetical protein